MILATPRRGAVSFATARLLLFLGLAMAMPVRGASAAELIMYSQHGCPWCIRWHKDIGPGYPLSPEGRYAPLREVDIRDTVPGVELKRPVTLTPTFVLVDNGREIGRVTGYPGKEFFWELLAEIIPQSHRSISSSSNADKRGHDAPPEANQAP